jgi:hypothetical protein
MATTTNYGWTTPDNTALVKDGADAIRTLGSSIDTSMNTALGTKKAGMVLLNTTTFTGVASTSLPASTFTSTYKNYRIILQATTASSVKLQMRMRASGTDNSTANYNTNNLIGAGASNEQLSAQTSYTIGQLATTTRYFVLDVLEPQTATNTIVLANGYQDNSILLSSGIKGDTTQYDSATFFGASGNISGAYSVYGYNL